MVNVALFLIGLGLSVWSSLSSLDAGFLYLTLLLPLFAFMRFGPGWYKKSIFSDILTPVRGRPKRFACRAVGLTALVGYFYIAHMGTDTSLTCAMGEGCTQWWNTWFAPIAYLALTGLAASCMVAWALEEQVETDWDRLPINDRDLDLADAPAVKN